MGGVEEMGSNADLKMGYGRDIGNIFHTCRRKRLHVMETLGSGGVYPYCSFIVCSFIVTVENPLSRSGTPSP